MQYLGRVNFDLAHIRGVLAGQSTCGWSGPGVSRASLTARAEAWGAPAKGGYAAWRMLAGGQTSQNVEVAGRVEPTRAGARRGERRKRRFQPRLAAIATAALVSLAAWGFLVWAAIDFGRTARGGDGQAWLFLAIASLGAVVCLFLCLMLVTLLLRKVGILEEKRRHKH